MCKTSGIPPSFPCTSPNASSINSRTSDARHRYTGCAAPAALPTPLSPCQPGERVSARNTESAQQTDKGAPQWASPCPTLSPVWSPRQVLGGVGRCSVTHLFPRLWLFLCLGTGGVGRLPATDASGQVGRRLNLAELEPAEGPVNRTERERVMVGVGWGGSEVVAPVG